MSTVQARAAEAHSQLVTARERLQDWVVFERRTWRSPWSPTEKNAEFVARRDKELAEDVEAALKAYHVADAAAVAEDVLTGGVMF